MAAYRMRSKVSSHNIPLELALLFERVQKGDFNYVDYRPLVALVIKGAPNLEIWTAVLDLISKLSRATPPPSVPPVVESTPIKHSSASQQGSEQSR